jgi:pimeloyl-ACP methyl ester carboxylesterase
MPVQVLHAVNGVDLAVEVHGERTNPAVVLLHGAGQTMLAWQDEFVQRMVDGGRYVVRFDSRDSRRSTKFPVGAPGYSLRDLMADVAALLDELDVDRAHTVGMSQGVAVAPTYGAQASGAGGVAYPHGGDARRPRARATRPAAMAESLQELLAGEEPDWSERTAVVEYLIDADLPSLRPRVLSTRAATGAMAERVDYSVGLEAQLTNPFLIDAANRGGTGSAGSPRRPWCSTGQRTRCSRSATAGRRPRRSPAHVSSSSRRPDTRSFRGSTGTSSFPPSWSTPGVVEAESVTR